MAILDAVFCDWVFFGSFISSNHSSGGCIIMVRKNVVSDGVAMQRESLSDGRDHVVSFRTDNSFLAVFSVNFVSDGSVAR